MLDISLTNRLNNFETSPADDRDALPWEELHLERKHWTDATLELRLEQRGTVIARCLATRHDQLFLDGKAPDEARALLLEAAAEWRRHLPPFDPPAHTPLGWSAGRT